MTEELAQKLCGIPIKPVRFAFDGMHENGYYQQAVRLMAKQGFTSFMAYVLYNYKDEPSDFYFRLKESVRLQQELHVSVGSFPMRYQPILDIDSGRNFTGERWTEQQKKGFMLIRDKMSISGQVSSNSIKEFEFWFGKTAQEFVALISYPKISELSKKKLGFLRLRRGREKNPFDVK